MERENIFNTICNLVKVAVSEYAELTGIVVKSISLFSSVNFSKATTASLFDRSFVGSSGNVECPYIEQKLAPNPVFCWNVIMIYTFI